MTSCLMSHRQSPAGTIYYPFKGRGGIPSHGIKGSPVEGAGPGGGQGKRPLPHPLPCIQVNWSHTYTHTHTKHSVHMSERGTKQSPSCCQSIWVRSVCIRMETRRVRAETRYHHQADGSLSQGNQTHLIPFGTSSKSWPMSLWFLLTQAQPI